MSFVDLSNKINAAKENVEQCFQKRDNSAEDYTAWRKACKKFDKVWMKAHYDPRFYPDEELLDNNDKDALETTLDYLYHNPYYFRSGYIKARLLKKLKSKSLDHDQMTKLNEILLNIVKNFYCREFRYYCILARSKKNEKLIQELQILQQSANPAAAQM